MSQCIGHGYGAQGAPQLIHSLGRNEHGQLGTVYLADGPAQQLAGRAVIHISGGVKRHLQVNHIGYTAEFGQLLATCAKRTIALGGWFANGNGQLLALGAQIIAQISYKQGEIGRLASRHPLVIEV